MAYVVGSVSVEVVPDFRNAQNAITAWFKSQPDSLKVPVRPDLDDRTVADVEREAKQVGNKVGKAMADGAARQRQQALQREIDAEYRAQQRILAERKKLQIAAEQDEIRRRAQAEAQRLRDEKSAVNSLVRDWKSAKTQIERDRIQVQIDRQAAMREGRTTGGLITRAVQAEIHQNAGLISAVIGGILAFGAPVVTAGAVALFQGFGAVAAAQSQEVRTAWLGTWEEIRVGAVEDARIIAPAYERMAASIAQSFQRLRPEIRNTFEASEAQIDAFSASLGRTSDVVLPGLMETVRDGMPVVLGFGNLLESTGTGLSNFFDILADKSSTSGRVLTQFGGTMEELLPLVGTLAAQGAELATSVLPLLNHGFSLLNGTAEFLGGNLASIGAGFLAFRAAQGTGRILQGWSNSAGRAATQGGRFAGQLTSVASGLHAASQAMPFVGVGVAIIGAAMEENEQKINAWSDAIIHGGVAAKQAEDEMASYQSGVDKLTTGVTGFGLALTPMGGVLQNVAQSTDEARQRADDYLNSLDPLSRAEVELERATNNLATVQGDATSSAQDVAAAQAEVDRWSREAADAQDELEVATRGVTEAQAEQAEAVFAAVNKHYAYERAVGKLKETQEALQEVYRDPEHTTAQASEALLDYGEALGKVAEAASAEAIAKLPAAMDESQKAIIGAQAALDELYRLEEQGFKLPPELDEMKLKLEGIVAGSDDAMLAQAQLAGAFDQLGIAVNTIPGEKSITISDNDATPKLIERLRELGLTVVELPDGSVEVSAVTDEARGNLENIGGLLADLDADLATPKVDADPSLFNAVYDQVEDLLSGLSGTIAMPTVDLETEPFNVHRDYASGQLEFLDRQRPEPVADLDIKPLDDANRDATSLNDFLDDQRPEPIADLDSDPLNRSNAEVMRQLGITDRQRPTPVADLIDYASAKVRETQRNIDALRGKTVEIQVRASGRFIINPQGGLQEFGDGPGMAPGTGDGPGATPLGGLMNVRKMLPHGDGPGMVPIDIHWNSTDLTHTIDEFASQIKKAREAPALSGGVGWQSQWATVQNAFGGNVQLHSAFRPGSITATGNLSYHALGRAIDITPNMGIFNWLARNYPNSRELIFSPAGGRQLWNGSPHMYSEPTRGDHWDHIHWAMRNGGAVYGPGGPQDDLVPIMGSNGEHMLNARDVQLMGGQQGVYAFREALNRGIIGAQGSGPGVRSLVAATRGGDREVSRSVAGFVNNGVVNVTSEREMMRQAEQRKREALASIGV